MDITEYRQIFQSWFGGLSPKSSIKSEPPHLTWQNEYVSQVGDPGFLLCAFCERSGHCGAAEGKSSPQHPVRLSYCLEQSIGTMLCGWQRGNLQQESSKEPTSVLASLKQQENTCPQPTPLMIHIKMIKIRTRLLHFVTTVNATGRLSLSSSGYMPSLPLCGTTTINNAFLEKEIQGGFHKQFRTSPLKTSELFS